MEQGNIGSKKRLANLAGPISLGVIIEESRKKQVFWFHKLGYLHFLCRYVIV